MLPAYRANANSPDMARQQQRPPDLGAIRPPVIVEKSGTHSPTSSAFGSYQLMRERLIHYFSSLTIALNTWPRSMKLAKRSKEVLAGDRITTSPGWERASAMATASW